MRYNIKYSFPRSRLRCRLCSTTARTRAIETMRPNTFCRAEWLNSNMKLCIALKMDWSKQLKLEFFVSTFSDGQIGKYCIVKIKFSLLPSQHFTLTIWAFWKIKYQWLSYYHDMCSAYTSSMEGCFSWQWISTSFMTLATIPDVFMAFLSIFNKKQQKFKDMLVANWRTHATKRIN